MSYSDYALIKKNTLTDTADAIRAQKGTSGPIDPADFGSEIRSIEGGASVPEGHTEVESIITDGLSYINTYISPNPNYSIEMEVKLTEAGLAKDGTWDYFYGTRRATSSRWAARFDNDESVGLLVVKRSTDTTTTSEGEWCRNGAGSKADYATFKIVKLLKNQLYIDDDLVYTFASTTNTEHYLYPVYLFAVDDGGKTWKTNMGRLEVRYVKMWDDNDNLVLDLIPVVKNDSTVCMYNKVNGAYYYNSGTGTFAYPTKPAIIDIDMNNNGVNIGTGGAAYNAINHNGTFTDGKFVLDAPGCLTVPTEFMAKSSKKPWSVAFTIDNYTVSNEEYSRIARGSADVPSVFWSNQNPPNGFEHKLVCWASLDTAISDRNCGTTWYDESFYTVSDNGRIQFPDFSGTKTTFIFRNNGVNTELWINGEKKCVANSSQYDQDHWAHTFAIGNSEYDNGTDYSVWNMLHLECSMLKLWDRVITDEEIAAFG